MITKSLWTRLFRFLKNPDSRAGGILFFFNAFLFGNFAVRLPDIKEFLAIDDGDLGMALLLSPLGMVLGTPVFAYFINKKGVGKVGCYGAVALSLSLVLVGYMSSYSLFVASMFLFGFLHGGLDISTNGIISANEKKYKKVFMSTSHGFWSLGAMVGSIVGTSIASTGLAYHTHFLAVAVVVIIGWIPTFRTVYSLVDVTEGTLKLIWPGKMLSVLIIIVFMVFMTEGAIIEWNAIFYDDVLNSPVQYIGYGFAAFSLAMALGRFSGDGIIEHYDNFYILLGTLTMAIVGLTVFAQAYSLWVCTIAMFFTGLGISIIVPLVFYEAGNIPGLNPSVGMSMISTLGYSGLLIGPPLMGFVSDAYDLSISYRIVAGLLCVALVVAFLIRKEVKLG